MQVLLPINIFDSKKVLISIYKEEEAWKKQHPLIQPASRITTEGSKSKEAQCLCAHVCVCICMFVHPVLSISKNNRDKLHFDWGCGLNKKNLCKDKCTYTHSAVGQCCREGSVVSLHSQWHTLQQLCKVSVKYGHKFLHYNSVSISTVLSSYNIIFRLSRTVCVFVCQFMSVSIYCIQLYIIFHCVISIGRRMRGKRTTKEKSEEFSGCAKESQACLFFGWVGQCRGKKKSNWPRKGAEKT